MTGLRIMTPGIFGVGAGSTLALGGATIGSNTLAVTGSVNISGVVTAGGGSYTGVVAISGNYGLQLNSTPATQTNPLSITGTTTSGSYIDFSNTGGSLRTVIESSTGNTIVTAAPAYSSNIGTTNNTPLNLFTNNTIRLTISSSGGVSLSGGLTLSGGTLLNTSAALTNGAAAQVATMNNSPTAGNPTKWIPINDNGTTRYIPAW